MRATLLSLILLAGCATFPEVDSATSERAQQADYLSLQNVDTLQQQVDFGITDDIGTSLAARATALRARAAYLRRTPVIAPVLKRAMQRAMRDHPKLR
jgi:hypothetical protein